MSTEARFIVVDRRTREALSGPLSIAEALALAIKLNADAGTRRCAVQDTSKRARRIAP